jgi:penicillin amidase
MYLDLHDELGERKQSLAILKEQLPPQWFRFLTVQSGRWDAVMEGSQLTHPSLNLPQLPFTDLPLLKQTSKEKETDSNHVSVQIKSLSPSFPGSNSLAVDGTLTAYSSAMLANDMHLKLRVPNIWFRASWYLHDGRRVTGVTLPGVPAMVVGTNESIAWGLTNSYGDWDDLIILQTNPQKTQYLTAEGWQDFITYQHLILSSSGKKTQHITIETQWGPVIGTNHKGQLIVHQWVAYSPQAVNLIMLDLVRSESLKDALAIAPTMGIPSLSIMIADIEGNIGWTIAGPIPKRIKKSKIWQGYLSPENYPVIKNTKNHRLWAANNRLVTGKNLDIIGFDGGDIGARAQQIRDGLLAKQQIKETDLLAIQLDHRALFLQRWQTLLIQLLDNTPTINAIIDEENRLEAAHHSEIVKNPKVETPQKPRNHRLLMLNALKNESTLSAQSDSIAYGLVRAFRHQVIQHSIGQIYDALEHQYPQLFKRTAVNAMVEYPVWSLISQQPNHLLPKGYKTWHDFFIVAIKKAYNDITDHGQLDLSQQTWGKTHQIAIRHPLSGAIPGLNLLLDIPKSPLVGDDNMPLIMGNDFGASMRMVVAPGQEQQAILHMPAGQSNHPLSSYYQQGHQDWVTGKASPLLPGKTKWSLELKAF